MFKILGTVFLASVVVAGVLSITKPGHEKLNGSSKIVKPGHHSKGIS